MVVSGPLHASAVLLQTKNTGTHRIRGWVDPRAGLYGLEMVKSLAPAITSKTL
jgi:hypothetical protein